MEVSSPLPAYAYRARSQQGDMVHGLVQGTSEQEAVQKLRAQGLIILSLEPDKDLRRALSFAVPTGRRLPIKELALFCRQFATMIGAGVPIVSALRVLARQTGHRGMRTNLEAVIGDLNAGETLASAFGRRGDQFPLIMIHMIAAGEVGGILDEVLLRMATQLEKEEAVRQKVKSALIYPAVVMSLAIVVVTFMITFVLPNFVSLYGDTGASLPVPTVMLLGLSSFLRRFWGLLIPSVVAAVFGFERWRRTEKGGRAADRWALMLPVFGQLIVKQALARFCRTFGTLQQSGVPILQAMEVVERTLGNRVVAEAVAMARSRVREGQSMVPPLAASGVFPQMILEMINVGEETGTMDLMLHKVAEFYEDDVQRTSDRLQSILEPLIIVGLALVVGFIMLAMVLPMFDAITGVGQ